MEDLCVPRSNIYKTLFRQFRLAIYLVTGNGASLRWRWGQCQAAVSRGGGAAGNARQPFRWGGRRCGQCKAAISRGAAALAVSPERVVAGADVQLQYLKETLHEEMESNYQHRVHTLHNYSLPIHGLH